MSAQPRDAHHQTIDSFGEDKMVTHAQVTKVRLFICSLLLGLLIIMAADSSLPYGSSSLNVLPRQATKQQGQEK